MQFKVKGILSYPNLFKPRAVGEGDTLKYSAVILIPKADDVAYKTVVAAIADAKEKKFGKKFPPTGKVFLKDGKDQFNATSGTHDDRLDDYWVLSANSNEGNPPVVVDVSMRPLIDGSEAFAGAEVWFSGNTYGYDLKTSKGIACGLNGILVTGKTGALGRLDGRPTVETMFSDVAVEAPEEAEGEFSV